MRAVRIDLGALERFEAAARLLANVLYPGPAQTKPRHAYEMAACHLTLKRRAERDPDWASQRQAIRPDYAFLSDSRVRSGVRTSSHRLEERLISGAMARALMAVQMTGAEAKLVEDMSAVTVRQLALLYSPELREKDLDNFMKRVWRPSKSVIHMAAAIDIAMFEADEEEQAAAEKPARRAGPVEVICRPGVLERIVDLAQQHLVAITNEPRFLLTANQLIKFELV